MKKNAWKLILCLALAAMMLTCVALAADAPEVAGAVTVSPTDGKLTVTVDNLAAGEYALLQVKAEGDSAAALMQTQVGSYTIDANTILYIDQVTVSADGVATFNGNGTGFLPKTSSTSVFVLGGKTSGAEIVGAMVTKGMTIEGYVAAKGATAGTQITVTAEGAEPEVITVNDGNGVQFSLAAPADTEKVQISSNAVGKTADGKKYVDWEYTLAEAEASTATAPLALWPKGDVNGSGSVNVTDYMQVLNQAKVNERVLSDYAFACGDVNNSNSINTTDYMLVLNQAKGGANTPLW